MENINFVVEVYALRISRFTPDIRVLMYRIIPVGTTFTVLDREPIAVFKGRFKPGYWFGGLDHPVTTRYGTMNIYTPLNNLSDGSKTG